jgi:predicted phage baseplate assembly protein
MPLPDINLDDRTFEQLFNEARRRIPAYTPEWTDHNDSDPGITFLQLVAYMQEMIIWRLNQVPEKNYQKFLELVGLQLTPAAPAHADLTFTLTTDAPPTDIPVGARVALGGGSGQPVLFETDSPITAVNITLTAVQSYDGAQFTLRTDANAVNGPPGYAALSDTPQRNAGLYLGFDKPFGYDPAFPDRNYGLMIYLGSGDTPTPVLASATAILATSPPVQAYWEYWAGDTVQWQRLSLVADGTYAFTQTGLVQFLPPSDWQSRLLGQLITPDDNPLYWLRYRVDQVLGSGYESPPKVQGVLLNTVSATNAVTVSEQLIGAANGRPNQTFQLPNFPILALPAGVNGIIAIDEGDGAGYLTWTEVEDFAPYGPDEQVYILDHSTGAGSFGDGIHGKIPRWLSGNGTNRDDADVVNIKTTSYRWGGGAVGNSGANTISGLQAAIPFVQGVTNLRASYGGADEESVADAQVRAPMVLRTSNRAVTGEDFAFLAEQTPGAQIARAQAFPLLNPNFRMVRAGATGTAQAEVAAPGTITVVVVPQSTQPNPMPSAGTLSLVAQWLDQHRLLTAELYVAPPRYRVVSIQAKVIADPSCDAGILQAAIVARLLAYFHPLTGGRDATGWDFGGTIYFSEIYRQILDITDPTVGITPADVVRIDSTSLRIFVDGALQPSCTDVVLRPDELVYSLSHDIVVSYS